MEMLNKQQKRLSVMMCKKRQADDVTYDDLMGHLEHLRLSRNHRAYVICYMMLHYCLGNKDMDCRLTDITEPIDDKDNHLVITDDAVVFFRKGQEVFKNTDEHFVASCCELFADQEFLLQIEDDRILGYSIGRCIKNSTYRCLGETIYFTIVRKHFQHDVKSLCFLAETRGCRINNMILC